MHLIPKEESNKPGMKHCLKCGKDLHEIYKADLCPLCLEIELFSKVKDYIRENVDVREQDVADHFDIPIRKVRDWIKEGRIQYKEEKTEKITQLKCKICGKPITFGITCAECHSLQQLQVVASWQKTDDEKMRFLGQDKN